MKVGKKKKKPTQQPKQLSRFWWTFPLKRLACWGATIHDNPLFLSLCAADGHRSLLQDGTEATSAANVTSPVWPGKLLWRQKQSSLLVETVYLWYCNIGILLCICGVGIAWGISQEPSWILQEILHPGKHSLWQNYSKFLHGFLGFEQKSCHYRDPVKGVVQ